VIEREAEVAGKGVVNDRDASLAAGLKAGAPEAAAQLCERYGQRLLTFAAARFPADRAQAEDIAVASLAAAAHNISHFDSRRSTFVAWMYGIARRQIREEVRRRTRLKSVPSSAQVPLEESAEVPDASDVALSVASRLDAQRFLYQLAMALSELEFEVLLLDCVNGLSAREIAHVVGRSERAVHSLLHRARTKARERSVHDGN
jgi:RNA polymerase sigma-70 factor, ECF subfamily